MLPHTKALMDYLRDNGETATPEAERADLGVTDDPETREMLTMKLKRKRYQMMLKKMLSDAGYGDLAKQVTIGKETYEVGDGEDPDQ